VGKLVSDETYSKKYWGEIAPDARQRAVAFREYADVFVALDFKPKESGQKSPIRVI